MLDSMDYGDNKITQHSLKVSYLRMLKLDTILCKEEEGCLGSKWKKTKCMLHVIP